MYVSTMTMKILAATVQKAWTDISTDRHWDRQIDRQTDGHTHTHTWLKLLSTHIYADGKYREV